MKSLKIDYISDIHLDFWYKPNDGVLKIDNFIKNTLKPKGGDVLLIAGDLGHYFSQDSNFLLQLKKYYNKIALVKGNHDLYLISNGQQSKYKFNSFNRIDEMKEFCINNDISYLDGTILDIDGIKIGGVGFWYDIQNNVEYDLWKKTMNDSALILDEGSHITSLGWGQKSINSTFSPEKYFSEELTKLKSFKDINILVTHVSPTIIPDEELYYLYKNDPTNMFYMSDNHNNVIETGADTVIFGHTHVNYDFNIDGIKYLCNPLGYKSERINNQIQQFEYIIG